jgi:hypothetical protein
MHFNHSSNGYVSYSCKEAPLTKIEKLRARTMMRNNLMFQSLGLPAIVSMIRRSNDGKEGSAITTDESAITNGRSLEYNPKDDEVMDGEEVDDIVVEKNLKVQILYLVWRGGST